MNNIIENMRAYEDLVKTEELRHFLSEVSIDDILEAWDSMTEDEKTKVFLMQDLERKVTLITALSIPGQEHLLNHLPIENMKQLFKEMDPDDVVDVIQAANPEVRQAVWNSLSPEAKQETQFLLRFDEDDAAGLMTPRYVAIRSNITVGQALALIRKKAHQVETVYTIYIVDRLRRLIGVISLRDLLLNPDTALVNEFMTDKVVSVLEDTDQEEVARILETYDFISIPVVDRYGRLLGIVTFDDVIDVIREEQTEDVYKMSAMDGQLDRYIETPIWGLVRKRIPWLTLLLLAGTITTNVLNSYEPFILSAAFLTLFIPVITQTGGNSGTQSSTLMIRGLATGEVHYRDAGRVLIKEILVGLILGVSMGVVIVLRSIFLPPDVGIYQAMAVGVSLVFVVLFSNLIGALAPLLISRLGFDPTVMAGPLMATLIDVVGLTIYFETARIILG